MSLALSSAELSHFSSALSVLLSPRDGLAADEWRAAAVLSVRSLIGADRGAFLLWQGGTIHAYGEGIDERALLAYASHYGALDCGMSRRRKLGLEVWSRSMLWTADELTRSEYYNDFVLPNRLHSAVGLTFELDTGEQVGLAFSHDRPCDPEETARKVRLLELVLPPFKAAVLIHRRLMACRFRLVSALDSVDEALVLYDAGGQVLHRNQAARRVLGRDPERDVVEQEARSLAAALADLGRRRDAWAQLLGKRVVREVRTGASRYRLQGACLGPSAGGYDGSVLLALERLTPMLPSPELLRQKFALTGRELEVTQLLLEEKSNAEIARALAISEHTARHHTESVLGKLGVHSRADVAAVLREIEVPVHGSESVPLADRPPGTRRSGDATGWLQPLMSALGFGSLSGAKALVPRAD